MDRVILHCDLNSFYASVELLDHPELKEQPVAVCGDPNARRGIILAKNEPAKKFGVKTAETIWQARRKCPDLVLLPAHHDKYSYYSKKVNAVYERYTDLVEPFSIDESWLDITGSLHLFGGDAKAVADEIRAAVREELGLTLSAGVSFNKIFAKMGSDYKKPDATTVITRENFRDILWPLPVTDLLFVGRAAAKALAAYGVRTIGDLVGFGEVPLVHLLGKQGATLYGYAAGTESSPVVPASEMPPPKSIGNGVTFPRNLTCDEEVHSGITMLADQVAMRLRHHGMKCGAVQLVIRDPNFKDICRQAPLSSPTFLARELTAAALALYQKSWKRGAPIRALTVTAQALVPEDQAAVQLDLLSAAGDQRRERQEHLEKTVDSIRGKYGKGAIAFAAATQAPGHETADEHPSFHHEQQDM